MKEHGVGSRRCFSDTGKEMGVRARMVVWTAWVAVLAGCGAAAAGNGTGAAAREVWADEPVSDGRNLVGVGESCEGRTAAEMAARAAVAQQVESSLRKVVKVVIESGEGADWEQTTTTGAEEIRFGHGEWIRIRQVTGPDRKGCYRAIAALDRAEGARLLLEEYAGAADPFRAEGARALAQRDDAAGFAPPFRAALDRFEEMTRQAMRIAAVDPARRLPAVYEEDRVLFRALLEARQSLLQRLRPVLVPDGIDPREMEPAVLGAVQGALSRLGVTSQAGGACGPDRVAVRVAAGSRCDRLPLGFGCEVRMTIRVAPCGSGPGPQVRGEFDLGAVARGAHPSREDLARREAWMAVTPERLEAPIRQGIGEVLPLR